MKNIIFASLAALMVASCAEDIDLNLSSEKPRLVVDGHLADIESPYNFIRLTLSAPYFSNKEPEAVSDARVSVHDGTKEMIFEEDAEHKGYYRAPQGFRAINGATYKLKITDIDPDGDGIDDIFTAESYAPENAKMDSIVCEYDKVLELYNVRFYSYEDTSIANYYIYGISYCDSLVSDSYLKVGYTDDEMFESDYCWGATLCQFTDDDIIGKVHNGDKVTLHVASITKEFYEFFKGMYDIAYGSNPMFSSAPANAPGNISGGALGFFCVMATGDLSCTIKDSPNK